MPNTFELIASSTVGVLGATSIDFTSIPSTFTDLSLKLSVRSDFATIGDTLYLELNGSALNFSSRYLRGSGSAADTSTLQQFAGYADGANETANTFSNVELYFPNYLSSNNKSYSVDSVDENNATTAYQVLIAGLWSQTATINRVTVKLNTARSFVQYSTAYLYGVKNA